MLKTAAVEHVCLKILPQQDPPPLCRPTSSRQSRIQLYGTEIGGDCSELRIKSTDDVFYNLRGHGGSLDMMNTKITSWDTDNNAVHEPSDYSETSDDTKPRSYIRCVRGTTVYAWESIQFRRNISIGMACLDSDESQYC